MIAGIFEVLAKPLEWFYSITHSYAAAIALIAAVVMAIVTPLNLKSTKGMLEMQRLAPEMRKLQTQYRDDRQKLNEAMMELYKEHKVNPLASCLPLIAQMPVFIIMYQILTGMTHRPRGGNLLVGESVLRASGDGDPLGFMPRFLAKGSELYQSLVRGETMTSLGLDLSKSPAEMLGDNFGRGLIYAGLVVVLGALYWVQQRMVAARAAVSPTMSPAQQKLMQYLPVAFAVFQIFFLLGLVVYYIVQTLLRIAQQYYITKRFYGGEHSLGRQAQAASERARELAKVDGGGGALAQARRDLSEARKTAKKSTEPTGKPPVKGGVPASKRTTAPKSRPTPGGRPSQRPASQLNRPGGARAKKRKNG